MTDLSLPEISSAPGATVQDQAYERLRNAVMVGALRPGTALTFRGLAQVMGLSPTPIREAVRRLHSEHAIEVLGNRRLRIPQMTPGRFEELVTLRIVLETHAAERAFPYISANVIERMTALDDRMDSAIAARDLDSLTRLNQAFHKLLYSQNPNPASLPLIESLWLQLGPFQRQVIEHIEEISLVDRHKQLLRALGARDIFALSAAIESDIRDGSIRLGRKLLKMPDMALPP